MIELNHMQSVAVEKYMDYAKHPEKRTRPWFEISGPAGSGKTFLVKYIMSELGISEEQVAFMALVGKATLALRLSGVNAKTIHSSIYDIVTKNKIDDNGNILMKNGKPIRIETFEKKPQLNPDWLQLVIDEGGMVGDKMGSDILSYGLMTLVLGDLKQLPPVMAKRIFLERPDVELNEIMRQDKDSPIIYLSQLATHGFNIPYGTYGDNECHVIRHSELTDEMVAEADIVICGTNNMRDNINNYIRRKIKGITEPYIVPGDKLICRQNKWNMLINDDISLVNGLIGYADNVYREPNGSSMMRIDFRPEFCEEEVFRKLNINHNYPFKPYMDRQEVNPRFASNILMEFGWCITCHLAQGSQYDNVLIYVENGGNSLYYRQWLYTAITRAKKKLTLVIG